MMKLSGGGSSFAKELNPDEYMRQALDFEQERCVLTSASASAEYAQHAPDYGEVRGFIPHQGLGIGSIRRTRA